MCDDKMCSHENQSASCGCGTGKGCICQWHHHIWIKLIIGIVVFAIVFCTGFKLGLLSGRLGWDNYGYYGTNQMMYGRGWGGMMRYIPLDNTTATPTQR